MDLIHRRFLVPSCHVDLTRYHPRPCLQYYIKRCQGPCVEGLTTPERYAEAVRMVRMLLAGREGELARDLQQRMTAASENQEYEEAARYRNLLTTVEQLRERQKMAASDGEDVDILGFHQEGRLLAVDLFHLRSGGNPSTLGRWRKLAAFCVCAPKCLPSNGADPCHKS